MKSLLLLLVMLLFGSTASFAAPQSAPNFVVINIDDLGYADIAPFGSKINRTPHLDRMAREGRKLTSFYAAPVCSPSRAALMTGCYAKRALPIPHVLFPVGETGLAPAEVTVAEVLKVKGYATAIIGKWHLGDQPEFLPNKQGFDYHFGLPYSNDMGPVGDGVRSDFGKPIPTTRGAGKGQPPLALLRNGQVVKRVLPDDQQSLVQIYTDEAVKFIRDKKNEPFFLYLPHNSVHFPIYPGKNWAGKSPHGIYSDWVEETDWSVGRVLDALRENGLDKRTMVIFTSDNGGTGRASNAPLRGAKGSTWEGGMRVPTIAWWPGQIPAGTQSDAVTSMFDVLPTFASLAKVPLPAGRKLDGVNIWPQLAGEADAKPAHDVFYYYFGLKLNAVREGDWKLHIGTGNSVPAGKLDPPQLYNLRDDVGEAQNVATQHPEIVARLQKLIEAQKDDLGINETGPGCRELGRVENPVPLIPFDATPATPAAPEVPNAPPVQGSPPTLDKLKIGDSLPSHLAPQIGAKPLTVSCEVNPAADGVIVAHGGIAVGYALIVKQGRIAWLVRASREAVTIVTAPEKINGKLQIEARLAADKTMTLALNGQTVATGRAPSLLPSQPAEEFCVGFDGKMTVGDYDGTKLLNGAIANLQVRVGN